jgi:hypothetical protein
VVSTQSTTRYKGRIFFFFFFFDPKNNRIYSSKAKYNQISTSHTQTEF